MAKISTSFEELWIGGLENDARTLGVVDGDLYKVRTAVKNLMIRAGWANPSGQVEFVSERDCANALQQANKELTAISERVAAERKAHNIKAAEDSMNAVTASSSDTVSLRSAVPDNVVAASFAPRMGKPGDHCPRCSGSMEVVRLANNKPGLFCPRDRVVTPVEL